MKIVKVSNKLGKFGSAPYYWVTENPVEIEEYGKGYLMFTEQEIKNAIARAKKNPEDWPKKPWWKFW